KRESLDEAAAFFEKLAGLAWEADHYVGADGGVGHRFANLADLLHVMPGPVAAMHGAQDAVAAGLQRHMGVLGDARRTGYQRDQVVGPVHGLDRANADFLEVSVREQRQQQLLKALLGLEVAAPAPKINAA